MPLVIFLPLVVFPTLSNETGSLRSPVLQSTTLLVTADLWAKVLLPIASPKLCSCYCNHIQEQGKVSNFCLISTSVQFFHVQRYPAALPIFSSMSKETKWLLYSSLVWEQDCLNCACQTNVCLMWFVVYQSDWEGWRLFQHHTLTPLQTQKWAFSDGILTVCPALCLRTH